VRGEWRSAIQPRKVQQMPAIVHDGNGDGPFVGKRFGFSGGGNFLDIREFEDWLGLHGNFRQWLRSASIRDSQKKPYEK
jgi:hypothetical protein